MQERFAGSCRTSHSLTIRSGCMCCLELGDLGILTGQLSQLAGAGFVLAECKARAVANCSVPSSHATAFSTPKQKQE